MGKTTNSDMSEMEEIFSFWMVTFEIEHPEHGETAASERSLMMHIAQNDNAGEILYSTENGMVVAKKRRSNIGKYRINSASVTW